MGLKEGVSRVLKGFVVVDQSAAPLVEVIWWPFGSRDKGPTRGSNSTNTSSSIIICLVFLCL